MQKQELLHRLVIVGICVITVAITSRYHRVYAQTSQDAELSEQIAEAKNSRLFSAVDDDPELVFRQIGGESLLVLSVRFGNYVAAIELIDRGADWLTASASGVPFCKLTSQRLVPAEARLIGQAIVRRWESEYGLILQKNFDAFVARRLAARQEPGFLPATMKQCAQLFDEEESKLFNEVQLFEKLIRLPDQDKHAGELFLSIYKLNIVSLPTDMESRPRAADDELIEIIHYLLARRLVEPAKLVIRALHKPSRIWEDIPRYGNDVEAYVPLNDLVEVISSLDDVGLFFERGESSFESSAFTDALVSRLWASRLDATGSTQNAGEIDDGLLTLQAIQDLGLERFVIPDSRLAGMAIDVFSKTSSRVLLDIVLTNAWSGSECRVDNTVFSSDKCYVDSSLFNREQGQKLTIDDFFKLSRLGFFLRTSSYSNYNETAMEELNKFLDSFVQRGQLARTKADAFLSEERIRLMYANTSSN